jgi:uncharacterized protein (DUF2236 family)
MSSVLPSADELTALVPERGSITWRRASDLRVMGAAGYALLLQVAHPTVGAGVAEHSSFQADPWGRLLRTLDYVHGTIYGGPALAGELGRRVREMHRNIRGVRPDGRRYHALEPEPYAWVHVTLARSIADGHALLGTPLTIPELDELWADWRRLGRLIGVRGRDLPETWDEVGTLFDRTVDEVLEDTCSVHDVLEALAHPVPPPGLSPAVWRAVRPLAATPVRLTTLGLLGPRLRERFGLPWSRAHEGALRAGAAASRASGRVLPSRLRAFGPSYVRWRGSALMG